MMKAAKIFLIVLLLAGCRYSPVESGDRIVNSSIPKSSVRGWVRLQGMDSTHFNYAGVKVEVEGTTHFGTSTLEGYFQLDSIPQGKYNLVFTYPGYDTVVVEDYMIFPPSSNVIVTSLAPSETVQLILDSVNTWNPSPMQIFGSAQPNDAYGLTRAIYVGKTRSVGPAWDDYSYSTDAYFYRNNNGAGYFCQNLFTSILKQEYVEPGHRGFLSGDSVYVVTYTFSGERFDPKINQFRRMNLANRSNVIGFVLP
jgi:hypothetical protein